MSFEEFPRDGCDSLKEVGVVFTRNKYGRVSSPPGYSLSRKEKVPGCNSTFKGAHCFLTTDGTVFLPQSLYLICLDFVAKNVSMVESFLGFPDIVGEELFRKVHENDGFRTSFKNLQLFCDAYGGLVLSKLSLSSEHLIINSHLEYLCVFGFLTELDVSHCRMGDSHELLSHIAHLASMLKLNLKDNCLSDIGVRRLTLPQRLLKGGLGALAVLDLSLNPEITNDSVKYLTKLASLNALNLSGTRITFGTGVPHLVNNTCLCVALNIDEFKRGQSFTATDGWAVNVINDWKLEASKNSTTRAPSGQKTSFYQSMRLHNVQKTKAKNNPVELPKILLHSKGTKFAQSKSMEILDWNQNSALDKIELKNPPRKKFKSNADGLISSTPSGEEFVDQELMKEYIIKYENKSISVNVRGSLLDSI